MLEYDYELRINFKNILNIICNFKIKNELDNEFNIGNGKLLG